MDKPLSMDLRAWALSAVDGELGLPLFGGPDQI